MKARERLLLRCERVVVIEGLDASASDSGGDAARNGAGELLFDAV